MLPTGNTFLPYYLLDSIRHFKTGYWAGNSWVVYRSVDYLRSFADLAEMEFVVELKGRHITHASRKAVHPSSRKMGHHLVVMVLIFPGIHIEQKVAKITQPFNSVEKKSATACHLGKREIKIFELFRVFRYIGI